MFFVTTNIWHKLNYVNNHEIIWFRIVGKIFAYHNLAKKKPGAENRLHEKFISCNKTSKVKKYINKNKIRKKTDADCMVLKIIESVVLW